MPLTLRLSSLLLLMASVAIAASGPAKEPVKANHGRLYRGTVSEEEPEVTFRVPSDRGLVHIQLEAVRADADIDLEVRADDGGYWSSRDSGGVEELLVPLEEDLELVVSSYDGVRTDFRLTLEPLPLLDRLDGSDRYTGELSAERVILELEGGRRGQIVRVSMVADTDTDLDLRILDEALGEIARSEGETAAESCTIGLPPRSRRWIEVYAYGALRQSCAFEVRVEPVDGESEVLRPDEIVDARLNPGGRMTFRLEARDDMVVDVQLTGHTGGDLDMTVIGSDGMRKASEDGDESERVAFNARRRNIYLIEIYAYDAGTGGDFTLAAQTNSIERLSRSGRGGSKWWGIFIGIEDYAVINDLSYTCGDALEVYSVMSRHGSIEDRRSLLLIDEAASRAAVLEALDAVRERADEDDVLLFFFSGHGGNTHADGSTGDRVDEQDRVDEYLCCYDTGTDTPGDLTDDELAAELDRMPMRRQILILDSCYSGGFEELLEVDGRAGILSSLETQVSNEAGNFKAGLLTGILMRAFAGEADEDDDGEISLQEMCRYVETVVPETCTGCQSRVGRRDRRCGGCGQSLLGDNRQIPVIVDRLREPLRIVDCRGKR